MAVSRRLVLVGSLTVLVGCSATAPTSSGPTPDGVASLDGPATVTLLRHGESIASARGILSTVNPGQGLTQQGAAEAKRVAGVLAARGYGAIFTSPLARASQTAAAFAEVTGADVVVLDGLAEISAGAYEGHSASEYGADYLEHVDAWARGELDGSIPGGESGGEFLARMDAAMTQVLDTDARNVLVVSHGEAIRVWAGNRVLGATADAVRLGYNGFATLRPAPSGWQLTEARPEGP